MDSRKGNAQMNSDHYPGREARSERVPLPGFGDPASAGPSGQPGTAGRQEPARSGIRHARRMSNWTAAALIVGTGAATVALAHQAVPAAVPSAATTPAATAGGTVAGSGPSVGHAVATTSASGVTVTTTTRTVNGRTVVTRTRHAPAHHDA